MHFFPRSAQFHCIPFILGVPVGVLLVYPVLLGTLWNNHIPKKKKKGKMRQTSSSSCLPPAPPCFLNLDSLCFTFKRLHWTFSWPDISRHTLSFPRSSTIPVGRMELVPWQPAVPNGLCSSALRCTVGKAANLARAQYTAAATAAAAADRGVEGSRATQKLNLGRC